ncbi:MAG: ATP-binding protein, partial [Candidatus Binatia bacterium]
VIASFPLPGSDPMAISGLTYWVALAFFVIMNVVVALGAEHLHHSRWTAAESLAAVERSDTRARRLFESSIIGILFWHTDGGIDDANDAFFAIAGRTRGDLRDGQLNWQALVAPDCLPLHLVAREQIQARGECDPFDSAILRPDGSRVPIFCGGVALDPTGSRGVTFVLDMSESRRTREALRESESRYRALFEDSPIALLEEDWSDVKRHLLALSPDAAGLPAYFAAHRDELWNCVRRLRVLNINRVALDMLGLRDARPLEIDVGTFIALEASDASARAVIELALHGGRSRIEQTLITADGERRATLVQMSPLPGHETSLARVMISLVDISERKQVEAEREQVLAFTDRARQDAESANRAKDEFLATVSHELRTPLSPILAWARMLREGLLDDTRTHHAYEVIERSARTQAQLIEDLLDVSRIMAGKMRLEVRPVSLAPILERAIEVIRPSADAKGLRLQVILDSEAGAVLGDDGRLQQVVWNLLANAVKFTPKGGRVQLGLQRVHSHVEIVVSDTGDGMEPDFVPYVFERFRQADASTTRAQSGLGLGLAIVRHIVEAHGGSVVAESAGRGRGSVFTVKLPFMVTRTKENDTRRHPTDGPVDDTILPRLDGTRILIVDDEADASEVVAELLTSQGAEVRQAHSAAAARALLGQWRPTLIVSDVGMPGEDGYAFIARWRTEAGDAARVPAVALTAYAGRTDKIRLLSAGFDAHVPKPLDPAELLTVLASLARSVRAT